MAMKTEDAAGDGFLPQELIRSKRDGGALPEAAWQAFCGGFLRGDIADYQMTAMLMAITLRGMTPEETASLTRIMRDSGQTFAWDFPKHLLVDKHSTGGIGDKTSIVVVPLCLCEGLKIPMIAGRGLGHTGGTLDKLAAVGWQLFPSPAAVRKQMATLGAVIMGQTEAIAPLDRRLYALRDVTATVESLPLIVGSILSKKAAAGLGGLVMDVKFGSGAFMRALDDARSLAHALRAVGEVVGLPVRCLITDMSSPLGTHAGNALEVKECLEILAGDGPLDTRHLCLELAVEMALLANPIQDAAALRQRMAEHLDSGRAMAKFLELAAVQGANMKWLESPEALVQSPIQRPVLAPKAGVSTISSIDTRALGLAIIELGGGRRLVADKIDPWVGLTGLKHVGEEVQPGEPLAMVHARSDAAAERAAAMVANAHQFIADSGTSHSEPMRREAADGRRWGALIHERW